MRQKSFPFQRVGTQRLQHTISAKYCQAKICYFLPHFAARRTDTNTSGITGISCLLKFVPFEHLESAHQKIAASYWWRQCHQFAATSGTLLRLSSPHRIK